MDQVIRELQRKAAQSDEQAASMLEATLKRIGRHALMFREQVNKDADPIEAIEKDFDQTHFHRKNSAGWHRVSGCMCCLVGQSKMNTKLKLSIFKRRPKNAKRKTLRTHRNGKARR